MSNRIDKRFESLKAKNKAALIPFITAGDPAPDWAVDVMHALVAAGSDLIEMGVPFSDPAADGPVIQKASERAIEKGVSLTSVLGFVRQFRETDAKTPVVLMGYLNPIERYGYEKFAHDAAASGVDGILLVDCPPEEMNLLRQGLDKHAIHPVFLVAPTTTEERMERIGRQSGGYIYYVSFKGITGANKLDAKSLVAPLETLHRISGLPLAVGFGIKDAESAAEVAEIADGVVIGSALVASLAQASSSGDACERAQAFLAPIREAMDNKRP